MDNDTLVLNDEQVSKMFGSIHTHFEDLYDTANDLTEMVKKFASLGAKRVALTGHGSMFAYEDLKDIVNKLKKKNLIPQDFEIVPGCEIYFTDNARHMVLIAKNYDGYQDLCKVIAESAKNVRELGNANEVKNVEDKEENEGKFKMDTPLVSMNNLRDNVRKGNLFVSTACIGGVFGYDLGLVESKIRTPYERSVLKRDEMALALESEEYLNYAAIVEEWNEKKADPANKKPTKAETTKAEKMMNKGDFSLAEELQARTVSSAAYEEWKLAHKPAYEQAKKEMKKYQTRLETAEEALVNKQKDLENYLSTENDRWRAAKDEYRELEEIFGKENIYFELQNHGIPVEKTVFNNIVRLAYEVGNPNFVASNDVHIGDTKGSDTWDKNVLKRRVAKFTRFRNIESREDDEEYGIKTNSELKEALLEIIEDYNDGNIVVKKEEIVDKAIGNIQGALEQCHVEFPHISIDGINHYPKLCDDENAMFEKEVREGIKRRFPNGFPSEEYEKRLEYEIGIIKSMGYAGYHLIVKDYLEYGRLLGYLRTQEEIDNAPLSIEELNKYIDDNNIPRIGMGIGPGRGSAAGSLCCFGLGITDVDPIKYGLLFERFLNPSRQSMPDIDSDFKDDIRARTYDYIKVRYGEECVSKICTKTYAYGKAATGIAQRYIMTQKLESAANKEEEEMIKKHYTSLTASISKKISKTINSTDLNATQTEDGTKALELLIERGELDPDELEIAKLAVDISGMPSSLGMHAGGVLISGTPLSQVIPLAWNKVNKVMTTQCLFPQAENLGLLKMDLLNIKNLSVITKIMQSQDNPQMADTRLMGLKSVEQILADKSIYEEIYAKGLTKGVFQVESPGMTKMMKDFKPSRLEDIVLLLAAYRPGPMEFIPEIIAEKRYRENPNKYEKPKKSIDIKNKVLNDILEPTYGVPIYQEQVMQIFQHLAGYSLADADNVRKYMSKKNTEALAKEKPAFIYGDKSRGIPGCIAAGLTEQEADDLFEKLREFAKYAFNKSHALCYAQVSVFTAYQKKYFTENFYRYAIANEIRGRSGKDTNVLEKYGQELEHFGIELLPPDICKSRSDVTVEYDNNGRPGIRLGFGTIKGESYKDYNPANTIQSFIQKNPDVDISTVKTFAELGMFDACWFTDLAKERAHTNGNRTKMVEWVETYGPKVKDAVALKLERKNLTDKIADIDERIRKGEKDETLKDMLAECSKSLANVNTKFDIINQ